MRKLVFLVLTLSMLMSRSFIDFEHWNLWGNNAVHQCRGTCIKKIDEIDGKYFTLFVKEVKKIDSDIIIFVQFRSKNDDFDIDLGNSVITLIDKRGREKKLNGCRVSNFHIYSGEAKVFPFVFKGMADKLEQPYELRLKLYNADTVVFSGLKLGEKSVEY